MRVRDVAERLEVSQATVYALIAHGKLKCSRIGLGRGVIRVSDDQLAAYLQAAEPVPVRAPAPPRPVKLRHLRLP
jgi:excisionase family DNA binding protein